MSTYVANKQVWNAIDFTTIMKIHHHFNLATWEKLTAGFPFGHSVWLRFYTQKPQGISQGNINFQQWSISQHLCQNIKILFAVDRVVLAL